MNAETNALTSWNWWQNSPN